MPTAPSNIQPVVEKAIAAHGLWKTKLKAAIAGKATDLTPAAARADNQCDFGQALFSPDAASSLGALGDLKEIRRLHTQFHVEAGKVLDCVKAGNKAEAEKSMAVTGAFTKISTELITRLMKFR